MTKSFKVIFFGTPDFSVPTLDMLANSPLVGELQVVSMPSRKAGRGMQEVDPEVVQYAKAKKISFLQTENINGEEAWIDEQTKEPADLYIVLAFAQFLGSKVLALPKLGCFNIHTSLLPKYRGAAPIQYALLNGDSSTGVSIQKMVKKMDAGDLCHSRPVTIQANETGGSLYTKLKFEAALACDQFLIDLSSGDLTYQPQDESQVSFAPTLKREDGQLKFDQITTDQARLKINALYPWPGTFCFLNKKRLKVFKCENVANKVDPGSVDLSNGTFVVGCLDGSIRLKEVQLEGKKRCDDSTLINGLKGKEQELSLS